MSKIDFVKSNFRNFKNLLQYSNNLQNEIKNFQDIHFGDKI